MAYQHIALRRVQGKRIQHGFHSRGQGIGGRVGPDCPHMRRFEKRQRPNGDCAVRVGQAHGLHRRVLAIQRRSQIHAPRRKQPRAKGQPLGGIVIAADEDYRQVSPGQLGQEIVQQAHGFGGRHGFVVYIACDQHAVGLLCVHDREQLRENVALIFQKRGFAQPFAQMQVGQMNQFHVSAPLTDKWLYAHCTVCGGNRQGARNRRKSKRTGAVGACPGKRSFQSGQAVLY